MRPTPQLLAPGFLKRSLDEFKRLSNIALKQEGLRTPTAPFQLLDFTDSATISACKTMSDADIGGFSRVSLEHIPSTSMEPAHARFHGTISNELPPNRPQVQRTGYAAWRSLDRAATIFGKSLWDIDPYTYLALRVKSDGRKYFVNVQTESIVPTDLHQHRLYARKTGEWETVLIKWNDFVRTNYGVVVEPQTEMLRQKVRTVGIGLIDRVPGNFDLGISKVWATNGLSDEDMAKDQRVRQEEGRKEEVGSEADAPENALR
ncbi:MAG: hypothetical protein M1830_008737 [Pleopsidium flavum]|nr:MAG: hypothetical protein M1830_008737 [Pleopsidium flavum]